MDVLSNVKKGYKLGVVGSRSIEDPLYVYSCIEEVISRIGEKPVCIVSGGAKGVDSYSAKYAEVNGIRMEEFLPNYKLYGKSAPFIRNKTIVENSDILLVIWDGESRGTVNSMQHAEKLGVPIKLMMYNTSTLDL